MGYIDCDTHVVENQHTWDYLDPDERELRAQDYQRFLARRGPALLDRRGDRRYPPQDIFHRQR